MEDLRSGGMPAGSRRLALDPDVLWVFDHPGVGESNCLDRTADLPTGERIHVRALGRDRLRMFTVEDAGHGPWSGCGPDAGRRRRTSAGRERHRGVGYRHTFRDARRRGAVHTRGRRV
jgi:hypothetical protein